MRLVEATVEKFYGIASANFKFEKGQIALFAGPNGSGKSSILKAIQFFVENYPYSGRFIRDFKNDVPGNTASLKACRAPDVRGSSFIKLDFELNMAEQKMLFCWRLYTLMAAVMETLQSFSTHEYPAVDTMRKRLCDEAMKYSHYTWKVAASEDIELMTDSVTNDSAENKFWRSIERSLWQLYGGYFGKDKSPYAHLMFELEGVKSDPNKASYKTPVFPYFEMYESKLFENEMEALSKAIESHAGGPISQLINFIKNEWSEKFRKTIKDHVAGNQSQSQPKYDTNNLLQPLMKTYNFELALPHTRHIVAERISAQFHKAFGFEWDHEQCVNRGADEKFSEVVFHAMLRNSIAFLQQDRSLNYAPKAQNICESLKLPGLIDLNKARDILRQNYQADSKKGSAAEQKLSKALNAILGLNVSIGGNERQVFLETTSGGKISTDNASGGEIECFVALVAVLISDYETIFIDEPGHNIHPGAQRLLLAELLANLNNKSLAIITHSDRMLSKKTLPSTYVTTKSGEGWKLAKFLKTDKNPDGSISLSESEQEQLTLPHLSQVLFSHRVILVEGETEYALIPMLQRIILGEAESHHFHDVIYLNGGGAGQRIWQFDVARAVCMDARLMLDFDKIADNMSKGCIQDPKRPIQLREPKESGIFGTIKDAMNSNEDKQTLTEKWRALRTNSILEDCNVEFKSWKAFRDASVDLRKFIWEKTGIFILERDVEDEVLRYLPQYLLEPQNIFNRIDSNERSKFNVDCDELHLNILNLLFYFAVNSSWFDDADKITMQLATQCKDCLRICEFVANEKWFGAVKGLLPDAFKPLDGRINYLKQLITEGKKELPDSCFAKSMTASNLGAVRDNLPFDFISTAVKQGDKREMFKKLKGNWKNITYDELRQLLMQCFAYSKESSGEDMMTLFDFVKSCQPPATA